MRQYITHNIEETHKLATRFAQKITPGQIYACEGELGAGKTSFIQGVLGALGAEGPCTSPTFTIVNTYTLEKGTVGHASGIQVVYHMDAYRITDADAKSVGWQEMVDNPHAVVFVEWPERIAQSLPADAITLSFKWHEDAREITLPF